MGLLALLPFTWQEVIEDHDQITEIIIDSGRMLEVRYGLRKVFFEDIIPTPEHIALICDKCGTFGADNRAGISRTLHRISRLIDRNKVTIGLTCRVGRDFPGCTALIEDLIATGESILLVGRPGVGKTTKLRDLCRYASTNLDKAVVIVDTSNEIAGDGSIPHPAVGRSRRLQVPLGVAQHQVMIEAVENHAPEIVVIDEVGNAEEAQACLTIAQRGVQLVATAHGTCLQDILENPDLRDMIGGVAESTLSDETMKERGLTRKTILERVSNPCFTIVVEILDYDRVAIHKDVALMVDALLRGEKIAPEERRVTGDGTWLTIKAEIPVKPQREVIPPPKSQRRPKPWQTDFEERPSAHKNRRNRRRR